MDLTKSQRAGHARAEKAVADAIAAAEAIFDSWTPLPTKSMDVDDKAEIGVKLNDCGGVVPRGDGRAARVVHGSRATVQVAGAQMEPGSPLSVTIFRKRVNVGAECSAGYV